MVLFCGRRSSNVLQNFLNERSMTEILHHTGWQAAETRRTSVTLDNSMERPRGQDSTDHDPGMGFSFLSFYGYT